MTARYVVVPFKRWHLDWLYANGAPALLTPDLLAVMEGSNWRTVSLDTGETIMCGGAIQHWPGRYQLNAFLTKSSGRHMRFLTNATKDFIARLSGRIEFTVRCDFPAGHRWAKLLGFDVETYTMRSYGPESEDHTMYVRHQ